jgi:hypothetical protein
MSWQLPVGESAAQRLNDLLVALRDVGEAEIAGRSYANPAVGYAWRGLASQADWDVAYVLTPWMLMRVYLPLMPPAIELPSAWTAQARAGQPFQLIGPSLDVAVGEELHRLHLQWLPDYGHFLLQPLMQGLNRYADDTAVWNAWDGVLAARDRSRQEKLDELQRRDAETTRRDFLRRMIGAG